MNRSVTKTLLRDIEGAHMISVNKETIAHAVRVSETPEEAASLVIKYMLIGERAAVRRQKAEKILSDARKQAMDLMKEVICTHDVVKRNPDTSGNSDSEHVRLICGDMLGGTGARFT